MEKIEQPIKAFSIKKDEAKPDFLVQTTLDRPETLSSTTYKIKSLDHAFYITISDIELEGKSRPYEMFISTKSVDHYPYLVCITRLISAFLRTGHEYSFIAEELKQINDPKEGNYFKKGILYPSLIAEIGHVLENHFKNLN